MKEVANEIVSMWTCNYLTSSKGLLNKVGDTNAGGKPRGAKWHIYDIE
jgi:hypothetical protein